MKKAKLFPDGFTGIEFFRFTDNTEFVTYFNYKQLSGFVDEFHQTGKKWSPASFCDFLNAKYDPVMVIKQLPDKSNS